MGLINILSRILHFAHLVKCEIRRIFPFGKVYRGASVSLPAPCSGFHNCVLSPRICTALNFSRIQALEKYHAEERPHHNFSFPPLAARYLTAGLPQTAGIPRQAVKIAKAAPLCTGLASAKKKRTFFTRFAFKE